MLKTPLYDSHLRLGAKMVPFAGYDMPVQYAGIRLEHEAVRQRAGIFDVSHMGNFFVSGPKARQFLQHLTVNDVNKLVPMTAQYSAICLPNGGVIDDIIVYCLETELFKVVVNAANRSKDWNWFKDNAPSDIKLYDRSNDMAILALQGPQALSWLASLGVTGIAELPSFHAKQISIEGISCLCARTGYTGEDGVELFPTSNDASTLWDMLLEKGKAKNFQAIGLGARDTLRLEAGLSLYGHELTEETNLLEAGLKWIVSMEKGDFVGRNALQVVHEQGLGRKMVGLKMLDKAIPREGYRLQVEGEDCGYITSGTQSPTLNQGIALAYVDSRFAKIGAKVDVIIRGESKKGELVNRYFYRRAKVD